MLRFVLVNVRQCSSMFVNVHQGSSMFVNVRQCSSMFVNVRQCSLMFVNVRQGSSVNVKRELALHHPTPSWLSKGSFPMLGSSMFVNGRQCSKMFVTVRQGSSMFVNVRQCSSMFVNGRQCSSMFVSVRQCSSVFVNVRQYCCIQYTCWKPHIPDIHACMHAAPPPDLVGPSQNLLYFVKLCFSMFSARYLHFTPPTSFYKSRQTKLI